MNYNYKKYNMKNIFVILLLSMPLILRGQVDPKLADYYFQNGELEKAATIYEKMYQQNAGDFYFERYIACLMDLSRFEECEKVLQKQIKKEPNKVIHYVHTGKLYDKQGQEAKAAEQYKKAIEKLPADRFIVDNLASNFNSMARYDLSLLAYERGGILLKNKNIFAFNLAELYHRKEDTPKMVEMYLNALNENPAYLPSVEAMLLRYATSDADQAELQTQIYARIQDDAKSTIYPELLSWLFLQKKDYKNAFRQLKSVDRLNEEDGNRIFNLALIADNDHDYDAAVDGYNYIISEKGNSSPFFIEAKRNLLACKRKKLTEGYSFTKEELLSVEREYESFLEESGKNNRTGSIVLELAELEAFYLKNLDKATKLLEDLIEIPMLDAKTTAQAKLSLGDFYLIKGERWEATLLYSQVDKAFKDDVTGHDARFKNAKLSYYFGDFDWAKAQFTVLKSSTSKLISNDAIDMDVFIMENTGMDSTTTALAAYAQAELLVFQNKYAEAFIKLDSLRREFPDHTLEDDIYYLKAQMYKKLRTLDKAVECYEKIITNYKEDIRADNALFEMAALYEGPLNNKEKAKGLYEKLFTEFTGSTLAVEARKRFRILRGDKVGRDEQ
jgi:tetratricopeptide (TPR) repeat protein